MKSDRAVFLGVDVGTTSVKAGLVDASGQGLLQASREYPSYPMGQSRVEQSAWDWWDAATAAVRRLGEKASGASPSAARHPPCWPSAGTGSRWGGA